MPQLDFALDKLKQYTGSSPRPKDFDQFWDNALKELDDTGVDCTIEESEFSAPGVSCRYLFFTGVGGARVCCKFLRPEKIRGKIPGINIGTFCEFWSGFKIFALHFRFAKSYSA